MGTIVPWGVRGAREIKSKSGDAFIKLIPSKSVKNQGSQNFSVTLVHLMERGQIRRKKINGIT